jgi:hypothetical protein
MERRQQQQQQQQQHAGPGKNGHGRHPPRNAGNVTRSNSPRTKHELWILLDGLLLILVFFFSVLPFGGADFPFSFLLYFIAPVDTALYVIQLTFFSPTDFLFVGLFFMFFLTATTTRLIRGSRTGGSHNYSEENDVCKVTPYNKGLGWHR